MDMTIKGKFALLWKKYFNTAELPVTFYYTDEEGHAKLAKPSSAHRCVIRDLSKVRRGDSFCYNVDSVGCFGGKRYLGFAEKATPDFELSRLCFSLF